MTTTQTSERLPLDPNRRCHSCGDMASTRSVRTHTYDGGKPTRQVIDTCTGHAAATTIHDTDN